jgi:hypothetical protein
MDVAAITKVSFTSADRVREVINNFNADGECQCEAIHRALQRGVKMQRQFSEPNPVPDT